MMVSGKSTACTTSQGTPEASSWEIQKAGLAGLPQLTTDMEELKSGEDWACGTQAQAHVCVCMLRRRRRCARAKARGWADC